MKKPMQPPVVIKIAQALFFLNTLIWIIIGVTSLSKVTDSHFENAVMAVVIGVMMFGNALCMLIGGLWLGKPGKASFFSTSS